MRRALTPLVALAERTGAAVVAVRHLNKNHTARAKHRGSGSIGIIGAVRSALLVGRDPEDPSRRVIAPVKQNLCEPSVAVASLGITEITLRRARKALGVQVRREGFGKDGRFILPLPSSGSGAADGARKSEGADNGNGFDHEDAGSSVPSGFPVS